MLPEIGLTSQAIGIFVSYFGDRCVLLHSMLSEGERIDAYRKIVSGDAKVVVGTRSAVFAPLRDIGLIVLDEEQETSYKSEKTPKYHARDIARYRCGVNKALMLLASATPSVESYYKGIKGIYTLIKLKNRYGNMPLPTVSISDLRVDREEAERGMIGDELLSNIRQTVDNDEQTILFVNRRGHSSHVGCHSCGYVYKCPNCSVSLTYHSYTASGKGKLTCHYCGYTIKKPEKCPECNSVHMNYSGYGTQLLQEELETRLSGVRALRMDADTTSKKSSHDKLLKSFRNREADILYGTQMVAKGLDFPAVTLVGVVHADAVLYMNDFRASERTFSLITQLIGRAGRGGKSGKAIVQTYNPDHQVLKLAVTQDYEKFFESEIALRKAVVFPPFCEIAVFSVSSKDELLVESAAKKLDSIYMSLKQEYVNTNALKFGPFKEGVYKINGLFRQKLVIKYRECAEIRELFSKLMTQFLALGLSDVKLEADINPCTV
jgi:primosomal protein N' (replication factor Y)